MRNIEGLVFCKHVDGHTNKIRFKKQIPVYFQAMFSWDTKSKRVNLLVNLKANKASQQVSDDSIYPY